ncbi:Zinc finger CCHC-type superfamily [Arabidopsis thaliana x Arabidopsis arenosa]|uniref:Zinc finger CCHC-type superfamily n=1 Tax=Arabidopsis thaliana x Arabidopsis arenosa TaxID=1240361 RepID=A0A8T2BQT1_9BRAS|nr:Zinc finger CCHC-type superfamily [Arabidopsis thaliana x Arabidopsis arenosa]
MEYEEDERSEYNTSEVDWGQEPDPSWSGEGDYDYGSWRGETDSEISIEEVDERDEEPWYEETNSQGAFEEEEGQVDDEIEPEPPDHFQDTTSNYECYEEENHERDSWSEETESRFSQEKEDHNDRLEHEEFNHEGEPDQFVAPYHKSRPWCEIPYSDHEEEHQEEDRPWCEIPEDDYEDASNDGVKPWCEETDSQISLDESPTSYGDESESKEEFDEDNEAESEAGRDDSGEEYTEADEDVSVVGRDEVRYINFAGHHQGPEAYLRWEQEMEDWLSSNQIPEEEKTIYAEDTLTEDAFRRWEQDAYIRLEYDEPNASWGEMKQLLYEEFVEDAGDMRQYNLRVYANPEPRRWILAKPKATPKRAFIPKPKKETTPALKEKTESKSTSQVKKKKLSAISLLEPHVEPHSELHAEPHPELKQGKFSNLSKSKEIICYRCHKRGHFAANCSTRQVGKLTTKEFKPNASLVSKSLESFNSCMIHLLLPKNVDSCHTMEHKANEVQRSMSIERQPLEILVSGAYDLIRHWNNFILHRCFKNSDFNESTSSIMHLFFAKSVNNIADTRENHKGDLPEMKKLMNQSQNQSEPAPLVLKPPIIKTRRASNSCLIKEEPPDFKAQARTRGRVHQATRQLQAPDQNRGVILSFLLKGEPPDAPCIIKPPPYQGKTLASQNRMKANLLSLGADCTVSRSKLFQGRGYDADIQTTQYQDDGRIKPAAEPKLIQTGCTTPNRPDKDICSVFEAYQLNHDESRHETTWRLFTAQLQNTTRNNNPKIYYHQEVMEVTSQQTSNRRNGDMRPFIESPRANQEEPSFKPTCFGNLTHQRSSSNWNQVRNDFGLGDINFLNQMTLGLPYLEAHGFNHLQTRLWRPGETLRQSEDTLYHIGESSNILPCTSKHQIRRISLCSHFPYMAALTLYALTPQRLHLCYNYNLTTDSMPLDVPRQHKFTPKLSRLKAQLKFPYLA